jgi:hypothetical protein
MVPHILLLFLLLLLNPHIRKMFHSDLLLVLKNLQPPPRHPKNKEKLVSPHLQDTPKIPSPPTPSPEEMEKLASPHPQETPNISSPPPHHHHLLLLMKQQDLHPQTEVLKTIMPKQV